MAREREGLLGMGLLKPHQFCTVECLMEKSDVRFI